MGIDARVSLPPNVRVNDVATVLGALLGRPVRREPMGDIWHAAVDGVRVESAPGLPQCANICLSHNGTDYDRYLFHFEGHGGRRLIIRRSRMEHIALFCELARFFGGSVDFNDHDECDADFVVEDGADEANCPEDGEPWRRLQERIADVRPLNDRYVASHARDAAY